MSVLKKIVARIEDTKMAKYLSQEPTLSNEPLGPVSELRGPSSSSAKRCSPCLSLPVDCPQSATKFCQLPSPAFDLDILTEPGSDRVPTPGFPQDTSASQESSLAFDTVPEDYDYVYKNSLEVQQQFSPEKSSTSHNSIWIPTTNSSPHKTAGIAALSNQYQQPPPQSSAMSLAKEGIALDQQLHIVSSWYLLPYMNDPTEQTAMDFIEQDKLDWSWLVDAMDHSDSDAVKNSSN